MIVQDIMQPHVTVISPKTPLREATRLLQRRNVRHLPVVDAGELVGIVSDRDLKGAMLSAATALEGAALAARIEELTAAQIMTQPVTTTGPMFPVEEAARLMVVGRISALPVTDHGHLVGIVTETDVLRLLVTVMGATEPSSRLDVVLTRDASALADVVTTVERAGTTISSIVTLSGPGDAKQLTIRMTTIDPRPAVRALEAKGYTVRGSWRG
jgi:acetoin utilization protein AcuB